MPMIGAPYVFPPYVFTPAQGPKKGELWEIRCGPAPTFAPPDEPNPAVGLTWIARRMDLEEGIEYPIPDIEPLRRLAEIFGNQTAAELVPNLP